MLINANEHAKLKHVSPLPMHSIAFNKPANAFDVLQTACQLRVAD